MPAAAGQRTEDTPPLIPGPGGRGLRAPAQPRPGGRCRAELETKVHMKVRNHGEGPY